MAPWVIAGALALQKIQEQQAKGSARRSARGDMHAERAAELGYPVAGYGAGKQAQQINQIEGPNYLGMLMDAEERKPDGKELGGRDYLRTFMG
jgi:hypothetical protein